MEQRKQCLSDGVVLVVPVLLVEAGGTF